MRTIAVDEKLSNVKQALSDGGYQVVSMDNCAGADCCIISGMEENALGIADTRTDAPVINAEGKTAEEVVRAVREHLV